MALIVTQALPVSRVFYSLNYSNKLSLLLSQPLLGPLFIQTIEFTCVADNQVASSITAGNAARGGKVLLYVNAANFDPLVEQRVLPFKVVLSYDDLTLKVVKLELVREVAAVTANLVQRLVVNVVPSVLPESVILAEGDGTGDAHPPAE
jgi:hypothetical protein